MLSAEAVRYESPRELAVLGGLLVPLGIMGTRLVADFLNIRREARR
jgi:hypothetical protein